MLLPMYSVILLAAITALTPIQAQDVIKGRVFEDINNNQLFDQADKALTGVSVSNLIHVVLTDSSGTFSIAPNEDSDIINISLPNGYVGNWWGRHKSDLNEPILFPLYKSGAKSSFTFIHASDTHLESRNVHRIRKLSRMVDSLGVDFVVITGDLIRDALRVGEEESLELYQLFVDEISKFNVPVWCVPGNHEIFGIERHKSLVSSDHPLYGKKMYQHFLGPNYYSFNYGGVHFIGLDAISYDDLWYYGDISDVQLEWLKMDLANVTHGTPLVTFSHMALVSPGLGLGGYEEDGPGRTIIKVDGKYRFRHIIANAENVIAMLRDWPFPLALAGHFHSAQSALFETQGNQTLFSQTSAIRGPSSYFYGGMKVTSGFTIFVMKDGQVVSSQFVPLD